MKVGLLVGFAVALLSRSVTSSDTKDGGAVNPIDDQIEYEYRNIDPFVEDLLRQVNDLRRARGVPDLCLNQQLINSAQKHADDMAYDGVLRHYQTFERIHAFGQPSNTYMAENIAVNAQGSVAQCPDGSSVQVEDVWSSGKHCVCSLYHSPRHYENMVNSNYNQIGIAYRKGPWKGYDAYYWVQNFSRSNLPCVASGQPSPKATDPTYPTEPNNPAGESEYPTTDPTEPNSPAHEPDYSTTKPDYPVAEPNNPAGESEYPTADPNYPTDPTASTAPEPSGSPLDQYPSLDAPQDYGTYPVHVPHRKKCYKRIRRN